MPSVRFSRDKRGYEYVYLVHTPVRRGRPGRQRLLYWYRTPPGVSIGRKPFDEDVQRALERQHPGITFDWKAIISTPMPAPDMAEYWRDRRRAERAAKQERRAAEAAETAEAGGAAPVPEPTADTGDNGEVGVGPALYELAADPNAPRLQVVTAEPVHGSPGDTLSDAGSAGPANAARRRRRRGRRRRPDAPDGTIDPSDSTPEEQ